MSLRLFHRVRLAPGMTLNVSKSGPSLSLGVRGAHVTLGKSGIRRTVGLPGSGVFYTSRDGWHSGAHTHGGFAKATVEVVMVFILTLFLFLFVVGLAAFLCYVAMRLS